MGWRVKYVALVGDSKTLGLFPKTGRICQQCKNTKQREYRKLNGDSCTKLYEKTKKGFLMRSYRNMESRVTGIQHKKAHLYLGLEILDREEFYEWGMGSEDFHNQFEDYEKSGYEMRLAPSVDRINSDDGYVLTNMRWLPHWKNSQLGSYSRFNKEKQ